MTNQNRKLPSLLELVQEVETQSFAVGGPVPFTDLPKHSSLNPATYPKPEYTFSKNSFVDYIPQAKTVLGGVSGSYDSKKLSIGAHATGTTSLRAIKLLTGYGVNAQYRPNNRLSANVNLSKEKPKRVRGFKEVRYNRAG